MHLIWHVPSRDVPYDDTRSSLTGPPVIKGCSMLHHPRSSFIVRPIKFNPPRWKYPRCTAMKLFVPLTIPSCCISISIYIVRRFFFFLFEGVKENKFREKFFCSSRRHEIKNFCFYKKYFIFQRRRRRRQRLVSMLLNKFLYEC